MTHLVLGTTLTDAWVITLEHLVARGGEEFGLIVEMIDPAPSHVGPDIIQHVDELLARKDHDPVATVANTIFPASLAASSPDRPTLYRRYQALLPRLRRLKGNKKGLYFERLISYPLQPDSIRANQIEAIIGDLSAQLARRAKHQGPLGSVYEAQVFAPGKDRLPQGFPCMSSLSFQLDPLGISFFGPHLL